MSRGRNKTTPRRRRLAQTHTSHIPKHAKTPRGVGWKKARNRARSPRMSLRWAQTHKHSQHKTTTLALSETVYPRAPSAQSELAASSTENSSSLLSTTLSCFGAVVSATAPTKLGSAAEGRGRAQSAVVSAVTGVNGSRLKVGEVGVLVDGVVTFPQSAHTPTRGRERVVAAFTRAQNGKSLNGREYRGAARTLTAFSEAWCAHLLPPPNIYPWVCAPTIPNPTGKNLPRVPSARRKGVPSWRTPTRGSTPTTEAVRAPVQNRGKHFREIK